VIVTAHYLLVSFRHRPAKVRELPTIAVACGLLLATWFGWSITAYGLHTTVASNTSVTMSQNYEGSTVEKIAGNLFDTIVPGASRDPVDDVRLGQPNQAGRWRDTAFLLYQANLLVGLGSLGGLVLLALFCQLVVRGPRTRERFFWLMFIPAAVILGILVTGERDLHGLAHLTMLPLELLGLVWLAAAFGQRRWAAWLILAGALVDFGAGVFLQARIQNLENAPGREVFGGLAYTNGKFAMGAQGPESLNSSAWRNWYEKHQYGLATDWLRQIDQIHDDNPSFPKAAQSARTFLHGELEADRIFWHGWFARHNGVFSYFGDNFGDGWIPGVMLLLLAAGLAWRLVIQIPSTADPQVRGRPPGRPASRAPKKLPRRGTA
jgi:hypothetical protein